MNAQEHEAATAAATGAAQSSWPSEHRAGRWTMTAAGFAPAGATMASIVLSGTEHVAPVIDRLYLFVAVLDREPQFQRFAVSFVE
jgi:hypothetical protein